MGIAMGWGDVPRGLDVHRLMEIFDDVLLRVSPRDQYQVLYARDGPRRVVDGVGVVEWSVGAFVSNVVLLELD